MILLNEELIKSNTYLPDIDLYPLCRSLSKMSNAHSLRIMYLLHKLYKKKNIHNASIIAIPLNLLIDYLQISDDEDPLKVIQGAIFSIMENPIHIVRLTGGEEENNSLRKWNGSSWIIDYTFSDNSEILYLHMNIDILKYLCLMEELRDVKNDDLIRLSRTFPTWLYIVLMNASKHGMYWVISVEMFGKISMLEDRQAWSNSRLGRGILTGNLGLTHNLRVREEFYLSRTNKRKIHFIAWDIRKGNVQTIRTKTALLFNVCAIKKEKGEYSHCAFSFNLEDDAGVIEINSFPYCPTFEEEYKQKEHIIDEIRILTKNKMPI